MLLHIISCAEVEVLADQQTAHLVFLTCVAIHLVHVGRTLKDKKQKGVSRWRIGHQKEGKLSEEGGTHLAGVACAAFLDVTVIHRISAHNSKEFHLQ